MTGNLLLDLAISLGGIAFLVGLSWAFGAWRTVPVTKAAAADRIGLDEPDFQPQHWLLDADNKVAVAASGEGEAVVVFAMGDNFATRRLALSPSGFSATSEGLVVELGETSRRRLRVNAPEEEVRAWLHEVGLGG